MCGWRVILRCFPPWPILRKRKRPTENDDEITERCSTRSQDVLSIFPHYAVLHHFHYTQLELKFPVQCSDDS